MPYIWHACSEVACLHIRFFRLMRQPTANASADFYACRLTPAAYKDYRFYG